MAAWNWLRTKEAICEKLGDFKRGPHFMEGVEEAKRCKWGRLGGELRFKVGITEKDTCYRGGK